MVVHLQVPVALATRDQFNELQLGLSAGETSVRSVWSFARP